jgi:hypothetical protein
MQERIGPATSCAERPGRWVADPSWPSPHVSAREIGLPDATRSARGLQLTGLESGVWCGDGGPADLPGDQRPDDGASISWDLPAADERLELLGRPAAELELAADRPVAFVVARLSEVGPAASPRCYAVPAGARAAARDLTDVLAVGVAIARAGDGHRVRRASGASGAVAFGARRLAAAVRAARVGARADEDYSRQGRAGWIVHRDIAAQSVDVEFPWIDHVHVLRESGTELAERNVVHYRLREGEPLSAAVAAEVEVGLARGDWRTRVVARGEMTCTRETFLLTTAVDAYEDGVRAFARTWTHEIPRDGG